MQNLPPIQIPETYNYVGAFLMLGCNLTCSYCINHMSGQAMGGKPMKAAQWIEGLSRLSNRLPLTLQGGEPSIHPQFFELIEGLPKHFELDLLTNIQFDVKAFAQRIPAQRLKRDAPYASIRVSYHPETMNWEETKTKVLYLAEKGYSIGIWSVEDPTHVEAIMKAREEASAIGLDYRLKPLIGKVGNTLYGEFKYPNAIGQEVGRDCDCKTTELLIAPDGYIYRCHHDLYNRIDPIGHLLDENFAIDESFRFCANYGKCNPCDVKIKNNRLQQFGHTSVEIKNIRA